MNLSNIFSTIDTQVLGETFRIVIQSPISLPEGDIGENHKWLQENFTAEKQLLLNEPRGHRGINGCLILPANDAAYELLFFNHAAASVFKYEGLAASLTALLETGNVKPNKKNEYTIKTPFGQFLLEAKLENNQVTSIKMRISDAEISNKDISNSFVCIDGKRNYIVEPLPKEIDTIDLSNLETLTQLGADRLKHYEKEDYSIEGLIIADYFDDNYFRTVTFEKDGFIRRTPGLDSTVALSLAFSHDIHSDIPIKNETIFSSKLTTYKNQHNTFIFHLRPFITGSHEFLYDNDDPLPNGFLLK